jgi:hypothetical protein
LFRFILSLAVLAGLAYGGLYFYYDVSVTSAIDERLDELGLSVVEVRGIDFAPMAPLIDDTNITANVSYRGAALQLDVRVIGNPVFSEKTQLELDGLQALRLTIGRDK